jgi:SET domain-containing protein
MGLIVKSSSLHGAGVYTTSAIKKGAKILEYTGPRLHVKDCEGLYLDTEVTYLFAMDDGKTIIDGFGMAAFVNHTCDPNCETDQIDNSIWILACRDIAPGEELTYDYNLFDGDPGEQAPCYCGLKGCRRTMFSEEEVARQKKLLRQRQKRHATGNARRRKARGGRGK